MAKKTYTRLFRAQFVATWLRTRDEMTLVEHCERFGVSRQAAYEWLHKFDADGADGLETKSSAPHHCPHETDAETIKLLIEAREAHPRWGPRKLKAWLEESVPWELELPAPSTIGGILKRAGLVPTKKRRRRGPRYTTSFTEPEAPNDVWTTDFKGHFRMGDRRACYPLTLADCFSRYLLRCDAYLSTSGECRVSFERAFVEYGLPRVIRSDNGSPFASGNTPGGLSRLSVWWVRLGIMPERIAPASPWENGRHERMHRTLKQEAAEPAQANLSQQQRAFDAFVREYNDERPHEALGMRTPSGFYKHSRRRYPRKLPELEYPNNQQLRRVTDNGLISWSGTRVFLSNILRGEVVGLRQLNNRIWQLYFGPVLLGLLDSANLDAGLMPPKK